MTRDLGEQNLTLLEQGRKGAVAAALDEVAKGERALDIEATTDGVVDASIHAPLTRGWTVVGFIRAPIKTIKAATAGFRLSKKF